MASSVQRLLCCDKMSSRLATSLCGIPLKNPVLAASGTYAYGVEFKGLSGPNELGGIVVKGLSREPMDGNPPPRLFETEAGMINSVGLQNIGVRAFVATKLPALARRSTPRFSPTCSATRWRIMSKWSGCSKTPKAGGLRAERLLPQYQARRNFLFERPGAARRSGWRGARSDRQARPLIVKLSPNVARIEPLARAAAEAGADAISLVNTFVALAIDAHTRRPRIGAGFGGLSGPAIKPIALRMVYEAAQAVKIPVIGLGGIATRNRCGGVSDRGSVGGGSRHGEFLGPAGARCASRASWIDFWNRRNSQRGRSGRNTCGLN